jgi:hypothetical protein
MSPDSPLRREPLEVLPTSGDDDARPGALLAVIAVIACVGYLLLAALLPTMLGIR